MKLFITKLDNGYTLTITKEQRPDPEHPDNVVEVKQRLVFETYEALMHRIEATLNPVQDVDN